MNSFINAMMDQLRVPTSITISFTIVDAVLLLLAGFLPLIAYKLGTWGFAGTKAKRWSTNRDELVGKPAILAIGTANPPYVWTSDNVDAGLDWKRKNLSLSDDFVDFMKKVHRTSGVKTRYCGCPPPDAEKIARGESPEGVYAKDGNPSVRERSAYWEEWAPKMAINAATKAVKEWGGEKSKITHVIFHSCTGFKAPGVELDIIDALNLTGVKRRLGINYMGCYGAFPGMSVAKAFCEENPASTVLLVCAEACYSHIALCEDRSRTIGNCFFADGAAACIIGAGKPGDWAITDQQTKTLGPDTRGLMTWRAGNHNYDMYLDKAIGNKFGMHLFWNLKSYLRGICSESAKDIEWVVHPGGRGILDFFCSSKLNLGIDKETLKRSYDVLENYGNMSSPTTLFVIKSLLKESKENPSKVKPVALCFGFGPGLTMEIATLHRIGTAPGGPSLAEPTSPARVDVVLKEDAPKVVPDTPSSERYDSDSVSSSSDNDKGIEDSFESPFAVEGL